MGSGPIGVIFVGVLAKSGFRVCHFAACGWLLDGETGCVWLRGR